MRRFLALSALLVTVPACNAGRFAPDARPGEGIVSLRDAATAVSGKRPAPSAFIGPATGTLVTIKGRVSVPAGIVANQSGRLVGQDAASLVGQDGAGVINDHGGVIVSNNTGRFGLLAIKEAPLVQAQVYLADGEGHPMAATPYVLTDDQGNFAVPKAIAGVPAVVQADVRTKAGSATAFMALTRTGAGEITMNLASTCVANALLAKAPDMVAVDVAAYDMCCKKVEAQLFPGQWPDPSDRSAMVAMMERLEKADPELEAGMKGIAKGMAGP